MINSAWNQRSSLRWTQWRKIRSYYCCCCCCCTNEPVIFSHCVHLKLGHRFRALLKVCSDRDDTAPLRGKQILIHASHDQQRAQLSSHRQGCVLIELGELEMPAAPFTHVLGGIVVLLFVFDYFLNCAETLIRHSSF